MTEETKLHTDPNEVIDVLLSTGSRYIIALTRKNYSVSELMIWDTDENMRLVTTYAIAGKFVRA